MREYFPVIKKSALFQGISEDDLDGMHLDIFDMFIKKTIILCY